MTTRRYGPITVRGHGAVGDNVLGRHEVSWRRRRWFVMRSVMCDVSTRSRTITHYQAHLGPVSIWVRCWADGRASADLKWLVRPRNDDFQSKKENT